MPPNRGRLKRFRDAEMLTKIVLASLVFTGFAAGLGLLTQEMVPKIINHAEAQVTSLPGVLPLLIIGAVSLVLGLKRRH